ncbi:MAG: GH3 auxin-responsive promoter family protein [Bdellovibrionia bacterium]
MKTAVTRLSHGLVQAGSRAGHRRFVRALGDLENVQRGRLSAILKQAAPTRFGRASGISSDWSYDEFASRFPVSDYGFWSPWIEKQRATKEAVLAPECSRFQPTSGSSDALKWIPYSKALLAEFDQAVSPWMVDMARLAPGILEGKHYWSLSWMPNNLRASSTSTDDLEVLPTWKRALMNQIMVVDGRLARAATSEAALFASLAGLAAAADLSLMSVWSPTFALNLIQEITERKNELSSVLASGKWLHWSDQLSDFRAPQSARAAELLNVWDGKDPRAFFRHLWPRLRLISAWESASSYPYAERLKEFFPHACFQGKGLWATEGVVTIPFEGSYPLALNSHFYEFKCLTTGKVVPSWKLERDQTVQPLLTTGAGFLRYALPDRMEVTGFVGQTPSLVFRERLNGCDLVGEKMSSSNANETLRALSKSGGFEQVTPICLIANAPEGVQPSYVVLAEGRENAELSQACAEFVEERLKISFHYRLARELNQLAPARALVNPEALRIYEECCLAKGMILGNIKVEPLIEYRQNLNDYFGGDVWPKRASAGATAASLTIGI